MRNLFLDEIVIHLNVFHSLSCWAGLEAVLMIALLSQIKSHRLFKSKSYSHIRIFNHKSSQISWATTLNSGLPIDLATKECFMLLRVNRFPTIEVQYPTVDLLSSSEPSQSTSVKASTPIWPWLPMEDLFLGKFQVKENAKC